MTETFFKGKRSDNGEWVQGCFTFLEETASIWTEQGGIADRFTVEPETVCEWIGTYDIHYRNIFDGDLIRHQGVIYQVQYLPDTRRFEAVRPNGTFEPAALADCEVVGNIYDNPGLWEAET